MLLVDLT